MERRKEENLGNVILRYLRQNGLETPLNEHRLIDSWKDVVGNKVAQMTTSLRIYNQILYVGVSSAALRSELMMRRTEIVQKLNNAVHASVIHDIVFRF